MQPPYLSKKSFGCSTLGKCKCLWYNGKILLTLGPDWPFNICILGIILAVLILFLQYMAPKVDSFLQITGLTIVLTALFSYTLTALVDPGIVLSASIELKEKEKEKVDETDTAREKEKPQGNEKRPYCHACDMFFDDDAEHCDDCGLCMLEIDHHCPLSGKCIAKNNLKYFYTFLASILIFFIYFMFWIFATSNTLGKKRIK